MAGESQHEIVPDSQAGEAMDQDGGLLTALADAAAAAGANKRPREDDAKAEESRGTTSAVQTVETFPRLDPFGPFKKKVHAAVTAETAEYAAAKEHAAKLARILSDLKAQKESGEVPTTIKLSTPKLHCDGKPLSAELQADCDKAIREAEQLCLGKLIAAYEAKVTAAKATLALAQTLALSKVTALTDGLPEKFKSRPEIQQIMDDAELVLAWSLHEADTSFESRQQKAVERVTKKAAAAEAKAAAAPTSLEGQVRELVMKVTPEVVKETLKQQQTAATPKAKAAAAAKTKGKGVTTSAAGSSGPSQKDVKVSWADLTKSLPRDPTWMSSLTRKQLQQLQQQVQQQQKQRKQQPQQQQQQNVKHDKQKGTKGKGTHFQRGRQTKSN
jgi:hypothetical protein